MAYYLSYLFEWSNIRLVLSCSVQIDFKSPSKTFSRLFLSINPFTDMKQVQDLHPYVQHCEKKS